MTWSSWTVVRCLPYPIPSKSRPLWTGSSCVSDRSRRLANKSGRQNRHSVTFRSALWVPSSQAWSQVTKATATTTGTNRNALGPSEGSAELRVAIAHDFAETFGGAERLVGILAEAFPDAPVHFILARPEVAERMGVINRFDTSLAASPALFRYYRALAPVYPLL